MNEIRLMSKWTEINIARILFIGFVNTILIVVSKLPYINVIGSQISFIPYVVNIILIILLFKPDKNYFLFLALILFIIDIPLTILGFVQITEYAGNLSYFLIATYIINLLISNRSYFN